MDNLKMLVVYISEDFSDDYWSDEAMGEAISMMGGLSVEDWKGLHVEVDGLHQKARERLCEILGEGGECLEQKMLLLLDGLSSQSSQVVCACVDSINNLFQSFGGQVPLLEVLREKMKSIKEVDGVCAVVLDSLRGKVESFLDARS